MVGVPSPEVETNFMYFPPSAKNGVKNTEKINHNELVNEFNKNKQVIISQTNRNIVAPQNYAKMNTTMQSIMNIKY